MPSPMITMMSGLPAAKPGAAEKAIEALFKVAGCEGIEGSGSRIAVIWEGRRAAFHRPARMHYRIFFGRIVGIRDIVTFHGETVDELEAAFKAAVDHYLVACTKPGDKPNKPDSGKLTLRIPPVSTPMSPRQTRSAVKASINGLLMF